MLLARSVLGACAVLVVGASGCRTALLVDDELSPGADGGARDGTSSDALVDGRIDDASENPAFRAKWLIQGSNLKAVDVAVDDVGAVYVHAQRVDFPASIDGETLDPGIDEFLIKRAPDGVRAATFLFGPVASTRGRDVEVYDFAVDPATGAFYLGGSDWSAGGALVARYDEHGTRMWRKNLGDGAEGPLGIMPSVAAVGPKGDGIFAGTFTGPIDFGDGPRVGSTKPRWFVVAYDAAGALEWATVYSPGYSAGIEQMVVDADGRIYLAGRFDHSMTVGGVSLVAEHDYDFFVVALEADGSFRWVRRLDGGAPAFERATLGIDGAHRVSMASAFTGSTTFGATTLTTPSKSVYLATLDADGAPLTALLLAPEIATFGVDSLAVGSDGSALVTGRTQGPTFTDPTNGVVTSKTELDLRRVAPGPTRDWSWTSVEAESPDAALSLGFVGTRDGRTVGIAGAFTRSFTLGGRTVVALDPAATRPTSMFIGELTIDH